MKYKSVRGMDDILPCVSDKWHFIESAARKSMSEYGYSEIRTPMLENTGIFVRGIGENTDIVGKEMYTFKDRKDRSLTLRPEGTASIVRSYIEHSLGSETAVQRLYYIGPMFRSERPQKGRSRQFHQIGTEVIGSSSPFADAEVILQLRSMLYSFGLKNFIIKLNTLGCAKDKKNYSTVLKDYLTGREKELCSDCNTRKDKNVLRVLDCKREDCKSTLAGAPEVRQCICGECRAHYDKVKKILSFMSVNFRETGNLVRGLDYYTKTVFEVTHDSLGSQDAIGAGGRYDNLVKDLGGPAVGAVGYAVGVERILLSLEEFEEPGGQPSIFIATLGDRAKTEGVKMAHSIRQALGITVMTDLKEASLKSQFRTADRSGASFVIIIGDEELDRGAIQLKNLVTKEQKEVPLEGLLPELKNSILFLNKNRKG